MIGFSCKGLRSDLARDYWRGLEFYNSSTEITKEGNYISNETMSFLEYLDIEFAGKDIHRNDGLMYGRASISASPRVPLMNNVSISNGAYDALNFTDIVGRIHIANSTISSNRGLLINGFSMKMFRLITGTLFIHKSSSSKYSE